MILGVPMLENYMQLWFRTYCLQTGKWMNFLIQFWIIFLKLLEYGTYEMII